MIRQKTDTSADYFLAGSGATDGVDLAHYELYAWCLMVPGWVMIPFYIRSMVFTMPAISLLAPRRYHRPE